MQFKEARQEMEDQVASVRNEMGQKLEEAKHKSEEEKRKIRAEGRLALSIAEAENARKLMKIKEEMNIRIRAEEMNRKILEEKLVEHKLAVVGYSNERKSVKRLVVRVITLLRERVRNIRR
eukprot:941007-Ditylum_brightwellii.AAC.1